MAYLLEYIQVGANNNPVEVLKLQDFLHNEEGFDAVSFTGVYDEATLAAVHVFQNRYAKDILEPWGEPQSTGYVYYTTQKKINELHCENELEFALSVAQLAEIGNYREGWAGGSNQPFLQGTPVVTPDVGTGDDAPVVGSVEEDTGQSLVAEQAESQAAAVGAAENSLSKFFRGVGGLVGRVFQTIF